MLHPLHCPAGGALHLQLLCERPVLGTPRRGTSLEAKRDSLLNTPCPLHVFCRARRYHALVLCPNIALCQQVLAVTSALRSEAGEQLLTAAYINASNPPPQDPPEIIISTPAALMGFITGPGPDYGYMWSSEGLPTRVRHVILDEADLLLGRAFDKPVKQLLQVGRCGMGRWRRLQFMGVPDVMS